MSGPIDAALREVHASFNVSDPTKSIAFYRVLLGTEPAKVRSDYAKFEIAEPPLVLSLIPGQPSSMGHLDHAGLRVRIAEELVEIQRRLEAAGMPTRREDGVECCYSRHTKFWIADRDGALWEIYVFHEDIAQHGFGASPEGGTLAVAESPRPRRRALRPIDWASRCRHDCRGRRDACRSPSAGIAARRDYAGATPAFAGPGARRPAVRHRAVYLGPMTMTSATSIAAVAAACPRP